MSCNEERKKRTMTIVAMYLIYLNQSWAKHLTGVAQGFHGVKLPRVPRQLSVWSTYVRVNRCSIVDEINRTRGYDERVSVMGEKRRGAVRIDKSHLHDKQWHLKG